MSWQDARAKFELLAAGRTDPGLAGELADAVAGIDGIETRDLTALLVRVATPDGRRP